MKQLRKLISMLLAWINAVWKPIGKFLGWIGKTVWKPIRMFLGWIGRMARKPINKFLSWKPIRMFLEWVRDKRVNHYRTWENHYRNKKLKAVENNSKVRAGMHSFLPLRLVRKFLRWVNDTRIGHYRKEENYYKCKRLMTARNGDVTLLEIHSFLNDSEAWKYIDPLRLRQKVSITALLIIVELGLFIPIGYGVSSLQLPSSATQDLIIIVIGSIVALLLDFFVLGYLVEDKLNIAVYYHRLDRLKAKLASKPAV